jgi:aryl-alcohol dehydrogenase-like predicted oxidoreductase
MSFGDNDTSGKFKWALDEEKSHELLKKALDLGINFFDTANTYSAGRSEEFLGSGLKKFKVKREDVFIATKVYFNDYAGSENEIGLSRKAILSEIDKSLKRLQTDYVDLYIIHCFDNKTPVEETMRALHELVVSGKVKYLGASAMFAWQFLKMQNCAERLGLTKFISMQNHYNLIYREEEREMIPLCKEQGVIITPYSPLAAGRLARDKNVETERSKTDLVNENKYGSSIAIDTPIFERVAEIATKHKISRACVALSW